MSKVWKRFWEHSVEYVLAPLVFAAGIWVVAYNVGAFGAEMRCDEKRHAECPKKAFWSYKTDDLEPRKIAYHPAYNFYVYAVPDFEAMELPKFAVDELVQRELMCGSDFDCHILYPISDETWAVLQVELAKHGKAASRQIAQGYSESY